MSQEDLKEFFASAIKLDVGEAPRVVASGRGNVAKQIETTARSYNIPVLQNFELSKSLSEIPIGDEVPMSLFFAISNLFDYIIEVDAVCVND